MGCFYPKPDNNKASAYALAQPSQQRPPLWKDESFPPKDVSIFGKFANQKTQQELNRFKDAQWMSIFDSYQLFVDKIEYKDAVQTFLGDCFFVAVVSSLAGKEGRISSLFFQKGGSQGVYEVAYYYMGERKTVKLDSYFPFIDDGDDQKKKVTIAGTNGKESWVLFLEKAFAKVYGSYAAISGGDPMEAMRFLTGAPAAKYMTAKISEDDESKEGIWRMLIEKKSEYLFTCGTGEKSAKLIKKKLTPDHYYTIISAFETRNRERLLLVRNPWGGLDKDGNGEWIGKWSDRDLKKHIEKLKEMPYEYKGEDDGVFHISYEDFLLYFESMENFEYSTITFNVLDSKKKKMLEDNVTGGASQVGTRITLLPGKYEISVTVRWSGFALSKEINHFVLNLYGPENVK